MLQTPERIREVPRNQKHVQILFSTDGHWVCSYYDTKSIYIYDSMNYNNLHEDHISFLSALHPYCFSEKRPIYFETVTSQNNGVDCGVYSIAFATSIIQGYDPALINYNEPLMRGHLMKMFDENRIEHFPCLPDISVISPHLNVTKSNSNKKRSIRRNLKAIESKFIVAKEKVVFKHIENLDLSEEEEKIDIIYSKIENYIDLDNYNSKKRKVSDSLPEKLIKTKRPRLSSKKSADKKINKASKVSVSVYKWQSDDFIIKNKEKFVKSFVNKIEELHLDSTDSRIEAENLVTWCMHILKAKSKKLVSEFSSLKEKIKERLDQVENISMQDVQIFIDLLCGHSFHTSWTEPYFSLYEPLITIQNNNSNVKMLYKKKKNDEIIEFSDKAVSDSFKECQGELINLRTEPIILNELGQAINIFKPLEHKGVGEAWDCNDKCKKYDPHIALELYNMLKNLFNCKASNLVEYFQDFIRCSVNTSTNKLGHSHGCYIDPSICTSRFLPLQILSSHFPILRSLQKRIYSLHNLSMSISNIEQALNNADYHFLRKIVEDAKIKTSSYPALDNTSIVSENYINLKYKKAIKKFTEISTDLPRYVCYS